MAATRAVLLDAGGTLFHRDPPAGVAMARMLAQHGYDVPLDRAQRAFHLILHVEGVPGPEGPEQAWRVVCSRILAEAGVPPTPALADELSRTLDGPRALYPDVLPALHHLRKSDLRLVVVSNYTHALPPILHQLGLTPLFDAVIYSWQVGAAKPDPRIYRYALEAAQAAPEEALMVGDVPELDVVPAQALGIPALHLDRSPRPAPGSIRSLAEVERHLRR